MNKVQECYKIKFEKGMSLWGIQHYLIASVQCINIDESGQINYLDKVEQINLCIAHSFRGVLLIIFCIIFIKDSVVYPIETYGLLMEKTVVPGENPRLSQVTIKLYHIMLY
jgi:hypothetical protein